MNSNLILKSDILDIIFDKRNKDYGAYTLRKFYPDRIKLSLGIMLLTAAGFLSFTLFTVKPKLVAARGYEIPATELAKTEIPKQEKPKKQEVVVQKHTDPRPANEKKFTSNPVIVDKNLTIDSIQAINENDVIGNKNVTTTESGPITVESVKTGDGGPIALPVKTVSETPFSLGDVDVPPAYPGGMESLLKFLRRNLNNPEPMLEGESVSVKVTFVVNIDGKLQGFKVVEDGGDVFNKEVIRVLKKMPDWIPGKAKGENVSVYYTIPVKFTGAD